MPLYDLKCKKCGHKTYDILVSNPDKEIIQKCGCGSREFEKLPARTSVRFKGEGWSSHTKEAAVSEE